MAVSQKIIFYRSIFEQKLNFGQNLLFFSVSAPLCSALGLLWQCIDSLRCANPFDIGWIDSCWQDALCHFVCCHLIGAPQFAFPLLFSYPCSLRPGSVWHQRRGYASLERVYDLSVLLFGLREPFTIGTGEVKMFQSCNCTFSEIKVRRCKADKALAIQWLGLPAHHPLLWMMVTFHLQVNMQRTASATIHSEYTVHIYSNIFEWRCVWLCICIHALVCVTRVRVKVNKCLFCFPHCRARPSVAFSAERHSPHEALGTCSGAADCGDRRGVTEKSWIPRCTAHTERGRGCTMVEVRCSTSECFPGCPCKGFLSSRWKITFEVVYSLAWHIMVQSIWLSS